MTNGSENSSYAFQTIVFNMVKENIVFDRLNPSNSSVYITASMFRNVTVPFICILGGFGNIIAVMTFLYRRLRQTSCNLYLALRSLSDTVFLMTLMAVWFDSVGVRIFNSPGICQLVVFTSYVTSFLSVWSVIAITFENYIRICHPMRRFSYCTLYKAKCVTVALTVIAVALYHTSLWTTEIVVTDSGETLCMTSTEYQNLYIIMTYVDTILTLLIPLIVILFLLACIIYSLIKSYKRMLRLRNSVAASQSHNNFSATPQAKVTRLLLAVSVTFVLLHTPIHTIKLAMIFQIYILGNVAVRPENAALKTVFENMYYLNFSANFVVFFFFGGAFRQALWKMVCRCSRKDGTFRNAVQQTDVALLNKCKQHPCNSVLYKGVSMNGVTRFDTSNSS